MISPLLKVMEKALLKAVLRFGRMAIYIPFLALCQLVKSMLSVEKCGLFKETANYEECVALVQYYLLPDPPEKESLMKEVGGAKWLMYISVVNEAFGRYARHFFLGGP